MLFGESVIFFNPQLSEDFKYYRKQSMQLVSKMRYISAQFESYLNNKLWYINASHANKMARLLLKKVSGLPHVTITQKVEANAVFAILPAQVIRALQEKYFFYIWDENKNEVRWMTSFDTTTEDIIGFTDYLKTLLT
jgi:threonine aldolase